MSDKKLKRDGSKLEWTIKLDLEDLPDEVYFEIVPEIASDFGFFLGDDGDLWAFHEADFHEKLKTLPELVSDFIDNDDGTFDKAKLRRVLTNCISLLDENS